MRFLDLIREIWVLCKKQNLTWFLGTRILTEKLKISKPLKYITFFNYPTGCNACSSKPSKFWVGSCKIRWLHLCRLVRHYHKRSSWIWYKTIWWRGSSFGALGNLENPFISIDPRSILTRSGSTYMDPIRRLNRNIQWFSILETI